MKKILKIIFFMVICCISFSFANANPQNFKLEAHLTYLKHPLQNRIITRFCKRSNKSKRNYIKYLLNIIKAHPSLKKSVDYNLETERLEKHKTSLDISLYDANKNIGTESAFELGLIFGFSECGYRNPVLAIDALQNAFKKPDTYFLIAEIYRLANDISKHKKIMFFYQNAMRLDNKMAYYNKALYLYELFLSQSELNISLQNALDAFEEAAQYGVEAALNDLAILKARFLTTPLNRDKNKEIAHHAFKLASEKDFAPAIYNFLLLNLEQRCEAQYQSFYKKYEEKIKDYKPAQQLIKFIENNQCGKKQTLDKLKKEALFHQKKNISHLIINTTMLKNQAFDDYNQTLNRDTHF